MSDKKGLSGFGKFLLFLGGVVVVSEVAKMIGKEVSVYECPKCKFDIEYGTETCPNCKTQLSWSNEDEVEHSHTH